MKQYERRKVCIIVTSLKITNATCTHLRKNRRLLVAVLQRIPDPVDTPTLHAPSERLLVVYTCICEEGYSLLQMEDVRFAAVGVVVVEVARVLG